MALGLGDTGFRLYRKNEVYPAAVHFFQSQTGQRNPDFIRAAHISPDSANIRLQRARSRLSA
ncbi:hypothetical protein AGR6A_Lc50145 [Agrobacterium sp. NCPPB 925]|nr:hypothetical protein AGR6A_Lc50145 [Agrobacterium sp. NCPPB 925]